MEDDTKKELLERADKHDEVEDDEGEKETVEEEEGEKKVEQVVDITTIDLVDPPEDYILSGHVAFLLFAPFKENIEAGRQLNKLSWDEPGDNERKNGNLGRSAQRKRKELENSFERELDLHAPTNPNAPTHQPTRYNAPPRANQPTPARTRARTTDHRTATPAL